MTHFMTGVIVPKAVFNKGEEERKSFIDGLMKPYSEEREFKGTHTKK